MTHRQFLAWQAYNILALNKPERTDHYLMQVACEVRRVLSRQPGNIQMDHFQLKFVERVNTGDKPNMEQRKIAAMAKAVWTSRVGGNVVTESVVATDGN